MRSSEEQQKIAHASWWSGLEIFARYGVQFVVLAILARLLAPADYGLVAMLLVLTSIGALLVDAGFGTALIQRQRVTEEDKTTVLVFTLASSAVVAAALLASRGYIAAFYQQPTLSPLLGCLVLVLPLGAIGAVPDAILTSRLDFRLRAQAELASSLLAGLVAILVALRGHGPWSLIWQSIVGAGLRSALLWIYSGWVPRGKFDYGSFRGLFRFGGFMLLTNVLDAASIRLQSLLIGRMFDAPTVGYYANAQNTQISPTSFICGVLNRVGLPVFSSMASDRPKLSAALRRSLRISLYLFVPCMLGLAVIADPLIAAVFGTRWTPAAPILAILSISAVFWPLHVLNLAAVNAMGRSDLFFKLAVIKKVVAVGLMILVSPLGPIAIAWSAVGASVFATVVNTHYSKKFLGYGLLQQISDQAATVLLAALAALAGWAVMHWNAPGIGTTMASIGTSLLIYLGISASFRLSALTDMMQLLFAAWQGRPSAPRN
jgi:O-antigen/teichoic acid export membrane protein